MRRASTSSPTPAQNDIAIMLGYLFGVIGFLPASGSSTTRCGGCSAIRPPWPSTRARGRGLGRYFRLCTDHKVVAMQYLVGVGVFFFVGGVNAMFIRTELLSPTNHVFGPNQYLTLVGLHGTMMMGVMTSGILGPFANYVVPLMIGSRRMAFPRIEAFTFWLLMAAGRDSVTTIFFGGFQTGWTGYQPLGGQNTAGYDAYIGFFALVGMSMTLLGFNLLATIITMRAPGMTWSRLPIFCWGVLSTSALMMLAAPMLIATLLMGTLRPHRPDDILRPGRRRQPVSVPEPVLGVRPSRGIRPGAPGLRDRARAPARVLAQAVCGATAWPWRGCSESACSASSSGSTTCSSAASTPTCGRSTCSPPS